MGSRSVLWKRALPLLLLLVLLPLVLFFGARALGGRAGIEGLELAERSVRRAAVQCWRAFIPPPWTISRRITASPSTIAFTLWTTATWLPT